MKRGHYKPPAGPELVRPETVLEHLVSRPDPRYQLPHRPRKWNHKRRREMDAHDLQGMRCLDHRTQEERERDIYGEWYPFIVAIKAEERHARRVAKAQSALRYAKQRDK